MQSLPSYEPARRVRNVIVVDDTADDFGGTAQVAYVTARVLAERGYGVVYFAGAGPVHDRLSGVRVVLAHEEPFLQRPSRLRGALEGLSSGRTRRALAELLAEFDPSDTVVHVHSWTHALSSSIFDAIADAGFRSLVTLHDYFLTCPNGGLFDFRAHRICHLRPCSPACIARNCDKRSYAQKLYRVMRQRIQARAIARANPRFAHLSEFTLGILRESGLRDDDPLFLPNPIEVVGSQGFLPPEEREGYLFVGRFDPEKNPELFCRALTALGVRGTLCGDGPLLPDLRRRYPDLEFTGWLEKEDLAKRMRRSKALALASSYYEASPLVCLEALFAAGVPSIVPESCGAISYIQDGVNGLWFRPDDLDSLCAAIRTLECASEYRRICSSAEQSLPDLRRERSEGLYAKRVAEAYELLL